MPNHETIIRNTLPESIESIQKIDGGWTNVVFEVNSKWIFRFLRDPANAQLAVEQAFLPLFEEKSPLSVPRIKYSGPDYIAYEKIEGEKFSEEAYLTLSQNKKDRAAEVLGHFLAHLHEVKFEHKNLKFAPFGGQDFWQDLWPVVSPLLTFSVRNRSEEYFRRVLPIVMSADCEKVVTHSDFGTNNVLFDPARLKIVGVIDFGDLSLRDPAADFATLYRRLGKSFAESMVECYTLPLGNDFWIRVDYESKRKLFFVIYFALKYGFNRNVPALVETIEKQFVE